ncbi:MAG: GNAT family N-acetyltransferase [Promethearchaeia archaeon]
MTADSKFDLKKKRIRAFFQTLENLAKHKDEIDKTQEKFMEEGLIYRQMTLPVENITKEFEENLKKKVETNMLHAKIRRVTDTDLDILKDLYNRAWLSSNTPFRPITVDDLEKVYHDPDTIIFIGKVYGMDAGFVILDREGEDNEYGIIAGLGVIPRFQRKGLGLVLGIKAWNYFKKEGVKKLRCEVYRENERSYQFIKSLGFQETGQKSYTSKDFEFPTPNE